MTRRCSSTTSPRSWPWSPRRASRPRSASRRSSRRPSMSPDGQFVLVSRIKRPFSRLVTAGGFAKDVEIWSRKGDVVRSTRRTAARRGRARSAASSPGPRSYRWNPTEPATLLWAEALDGGDPKNKVPARDRVLSLKAPFAGAPAEYAKTEFRFGGVVVDREGRRPALRVRPRDPGRHAPGSSTRPARRRASSGSASSRTATPTRACR